MLDKYNIQIKRPSLKLNLVSILYKTSMYAMNFADKPKQVEFYDIDIQDIKSKSNKKSDYELNS